MGLTGREKLRDYADAVASPTPAPGGGSVAAVCGALAAALARMVASIALGKKEYRKARGELKLVCKRSEELQDRLLKLAEKDSKAYMAVVESFSLPKGTPEQSEKRRVAVQHALKEATEMPLEIMQSCLDVLRLSKKALEKGSREAFTDAGSGALIAHAAMRSAELNVRVNLISIRDSDFRRRAEARAKRISREGASILRGIEGMIQQRPQ